MCSFSPRTRTGRKLRSLKSSATPTDRGRETFFDSRTQRMPDRYRLVTRSDFDGLVCAALLKELDMLDDIKFVHPKDMQDGKVEITGRDITTNLPYVESAYLSFDHHASEAERVAGGKPNHVILPH